MKRVPLQERIVFFLFEPIGRARTFLVPRSHVARERGASRFRFGAFQRDNFLSHFCYSFASAVVSSSSLSRASSSVNPKSDVTDCRTREALLCFSSCD
jgi:hypothetical protein